MKSSFLKYVNKSITIAFILVIFSSLTHASPVMTNFKPSVHSFRFENTFTNDFIRGFDVKTGGLCGGMIYSALDYYSKRKPIPKQNYRPAVQTTLHNYIYDRQVSSLFDNLDKWTEVGFNPFGVRDSEFFEWGLQGYNGGRLQELRASIDKGKPVPLGLQSYGGNEGGKKRAGNHQVLAIGYDLGRYEGNLGNNKEDLKIYIYDPNDPQVTRILVPDVRTKSFYYRDAHTGGDGSFKRWRTYFVDRKYRAHNPPAIPTPASDPYGKLVREIIFTIGTGGDDLRGGNDNLSITVYSKGTPLKTFNNVNRNRRWINNYDQTFSLLLDSSIPKENISSVVLKTNFRGGMGGDNWNMDSLRIEALGKVLYKESGGPLYRFTGDRKIFTAQIQAATPQKSYVIKQKSNGRFLDAHEGKNDNSAVTRDRQNNDSQRWILKKTGGNTYTIQQKINGRYLDAHEGKNDNSAVTRDRQNNDSQRWIVKKTGANFYTIQQKSNGRYLDAHEDRNDNSAVTRDRQNNDSQRWIIYPPL